MVQQTALRGDLLPSKPRRVRFLEPPLLASRVDSASLEGRIRGLYCDQG